jgi:hypothetical protein
MDYPFENYRSSQKDKTAFLQLLPQVSAAMPEFFRSLAVAYQSIEQKNMFNQPQGIRQSTGLASSLNLLLVAMVNDKVIAINSNTAGFIDALRILVLKWYSFGNDLKACLYFGYYFYTHKSFSEHEVKSQLDAVRFLVDETSRRSEDPRIQALLAAPNSTSWYLGENLIGDKLHNIMVLKGDYARVELPRPGYQITFKTSQIYDLRAPVILSDLQVERPLITDGKAIVSCPSCAQKCRVKVFRHMEITCPKCQQAWSQSA